MGVKKRSLCVRGDGNDTINGNPSCNRPRASVKTGRSGSSFDVHEDRCEIPVPQLPHPRTQWTTTVSLTRDRGAQPFLPQAGKRCIFVPCPSSPLVLDSRQSSGPSDHGIVSGFDKRKFAFLMSAAPRIGANPNPFRSARCIASTISRAGATESQWAFLPGRFGAESGCAVAIKPKLTYRERRFL